jgi:hypothetical protein
VIVVCIAGSIIFSIYNKKIGVPDDEMEILWDLKS